MKQPLNIEVEPLSEQRWKRLEQSLMLRHQAEVCGLQLPPTHQKRALGSRAWMAAAAAVAALALVMIGLALRPAEQTATLDQPSRITTGSSASHLALPGLSLEVQPESAVVVGAETPQGQLLVLDAGSIICRVAPRQGDAPLIVQAGAVRVQVIGTRFSVTRLGEGARVEVYEGVVEVRSGSESLRLGAGEAWPNDSKSTLEPSSEGPSSDHAAREVEPSTPEPKKAEPSARDSRAHAPTTSGKATPKTSGKPVKSDVSSRSSSQEIFEQATALESGDPARASALYQKLESRSDSWAQNALYARGRLAASRGNSGDARRLLKRYLEQFPNGSNVEDARAVLLRLR